MKVTSQPEAWRHLAQPKPPLTKAAPPASLAVPRAQGDGGSVGSEHSLPGGQTEHAASPCVAKVPGAHRASSAGVAQADPAGHGSQRPELLPATPLYVRAGHHTHAPSELFE